jgi:hypothetical protein
LKKSILIPILLVFIFSCSPDEETQAPTNTIQTTTPEPETVVVQYTLTVTAGEGGSVTNGGTYDEGASVTVTANPNEGYEFIGWDGNDSTNQSLTITINSNQTIKANFIIESNCEISYNSISEAIPFYNVNGIDYFEYSWQNLTNEYSFCINSYDGVSSSEIIKIEEAINVILPTLKLKAPFTLFAFDYQLSNWEIATAQINRFEFRDPLVVLHQNNRGKAAAGFPPDPNGGIIFLENDIFCENDCDVPIEGGFPITEKVIYHEIFHIHQGSNAIFFEESNLFANPFVGDGPILPFWFIEGSAEWVAIYLSDKQNWANYDLRMEELLDEAKKMLTDYPNVKLNDLSKFTPENEMLIEPYTFTVGVWFPAYLYHLNGDNLEGIINTFYTDLAELERDNPGEGFKKSFEQNFNISLENFLLDFDAFIRLPKNEIMTILKE